MSGPAPHPARWWHALPDGRLQCDLCPRDCRLRDGQRGFCFVRQRSGDGLVSTTWGRSSGFCVDPIEKKPLHHFYPGSSVLSFGTAGCNLGCRFCQNWDLSRATALDRLMDQATPEQVAARAVALGCRSVAFTYNDPVVFAEYAIDVAEACRARGVKTVAVTAGYVRAAPRLELFGRMDAANVDLKAFTEGFYRRLCLGHLAPVLETLEVLVKSLGVWTEITTLLIPGQNDGEAEVAALAGWIAEHLGPDVPLHFSAFHPDFQLADLPATPPATLARARRQALAAGLRHVYTGNVHDLEGDATSCAGCGKVVIARDWYELLDYRLTPEGRCQACGRTLAGRFDAAPGRFGRRRVPVRLAG
ncbi:MAG: AmmeMemoRadiSam system radical SAM enzyme [Anaeromyxobacter sp.]|nr:AmmeMemoRadiSam system radical SAM enzyme [Anaeromyxobacter sp.]MBL0278195.1 AmmeMemoRadiSam system radical SAM enzyme [Anaeromyxobacter sp.]